MLGATRGLEVIALAAIVAFVVIILAFFFSFSLRGTVMIGVPRDQQETSPIAIRQSVERPGWTDYPPRGENQRSKSVGEDRLSEIGNSL